jgi:hypothetical protein
MARAIESLVATAGAAIEKLQAHATSARALEAEARARLDALPPSADDDLPGVVKTRATLRVVCRSLHARLRETLRALEGARAAVDAALLAHHRGKTHFPGVAARPPEDGSSDSGDVRAFAASLARIVEEAEEDGLFASLPRLPASLPSVANETETVIEPSEELEIETDITHLPDALFAELSLGLGAGARRADPATLRLVVATLAAAERDVDARAALAHEIETRFRVSASPETSPGTSYSSENFAYGTTSLRAWTRVVAECPALSAAMRALARDAERDAATFAEEDAFSVGGDEAQLRRLEERSRCVVFGSSTGWLVFYAALAHGVRSVGYELLEGRVATARATARAAFSFSSRGGDGMGSGSGSGSGSRSRSRSRRLFERRDVSSLGKRRRRSLGKRTRRWCRDEGSKGSKGSARLFMGGFACVLVLGRDARAARCRREGGGADVAVLGRKPEDARRGAAGVGTKTGRARRRLRRAAGARAGVLRADRRRRGAHQLEREAEVLRVPEEGDDRGL